MWVYIVMYNNTGYYNNHNAAYSTWSTHCLQLITKHFLHIIMESSTQQIKYIDPLMGQCLASVTDG